MKYRAGLPDGQVNLPRQNVLIHTAKLTVSLALIAALGFGLLSLAVNTAVAFVTPEQEQVLMHAISGDMNLSGLQNDDLDDITAKLLPCTSLPYDVKAYLVEEEAPNAFALPGGIIYVTTGLMQSVQSENELAFIIGHELGHFKHKDHLRHFGYSLVLAVLSLMIGDDTSMAFNTALNLGNASYSRSAEREADLYGLETMQCAYGSVTDATAFFQRMAKTEKWHGFMASHPGYEERIEAMRSKIAKERMNTRKPAVPLRPE
jgi:predicted Zn-dependent protease